MIRGLTTAAGVLAATVGLVGPGGMAPTAGAIPNDPAIEMADVPNMVYGVEFSTACHSWQRFIFGRGSSGQTYACHYIPNQWPPVYTGFWVHSPPLYGVQEIGAPCPNYRSSAAQSIDGLPLECTESRGWQQEFYA
ncbi:hypothetical protein [Mycolicibacterium mengxianglii]|uniref:hypothetical protein n=1 Tax=Mycolicibacterium mengxianglii TaxID=2736649 RepID=UPI0018EEE282|nr:hypothetical protein [Mycolicibacterium mengxianglii]